MVTYPSPLGIDQLLRKVVVHLERLGLQLFALIDHSGEAAEVGLAMPETKLVIFGSPKSGTPLMLEHPVLALDLPLKLLIRETADRRAFVSFQSPGDLAARYGLSAQEAAVLEVVEVIARAAVSDAR